MLLAKYAHAKIKTIIKKSDGMKTPLVATVFRRGMFLEKILSIHWEQSHKF